MTEDPEFRVMRVIRETFDQLDESSQIRVLKWAIDKYSLERELQPSGGHRESPNRVEYKEEESEGERSRTMNAEFTDAVGDTIGRTLERYMEGSTISAESVGDRGFDEERKLPEPESEKKADGPEEKEERVQVQSTSTVESAKDIETTQGKIREIFRFDNEQGPRLMNPELKANSKTDFIRRLTYIYIYAHETIGNDLVARDNLNQELKYCNVYGGSARTVISDDDGLEREKEDGETKRVGLNMIGKRRALEILEEIQDPSCEGNWSLGDSAGSSGSKKKSTGSKKQSTTSGGGLPQGVEEWVGSWKNQETEIDGYSMISDRTVAEKGLFGLWAIRKVTDGEEKVVSPYKLASFIRHALEIKHSRNTYRKALEKEEEYVMDAEGGFQINPSGIEKVEQMISETSS